MSEREFSGGDAFAPTSMEYRVCQIMMKSELRGGLGAYEMGNAGAAQSGPSFGPFQYDIGATQNGRNLLESIAENATDEKGQRIISDQDLQIIQSHFYKPFSDFTDADNTLYEQMKPKLNAAIGSDAGVKAIDADFVPAVRQKVASMNAIVDGMPAGANQAFMQHNDAAKLILVDTRNQYGSAVNGGLEKLISMTSADPAMDMPGRTKGTTIRVEGAFGLDDMVRYKLETAYGQTDRGAKDVLRRISHCIEAAGVENVKTGLSDEETRFFKSGLATYLKSHGRNASMLDAPELIALAELGDRKPSLKLGSRGDEVKALQRDLVKLGYKHEDLPLKVDGIFGPTTRGIVQTFQRDHGLDPDGVVGTKAAEALHQAILQQSTPTATTLDHAQHPGHAVFQQALVGVSRLDDVHGRATDLASHNLSGALAVAARREGLERIDHVLLSEDATRVFAVQGEFNSPLRRFTHVEVVNGMNTPLAQSSGDWLQLEPQACSAHGATPMMPSVGVQMTQPRIPH
jgi:hypothetical protein